jgi:hypothetical protein
MDFTLLLLLLPSIGIALFFHFRFPDRVTWGEFAAHIGIGLVVISIVYVMGRFSGLSDTEIINGQVTGKQMERVSCQHSYSCHCRSTGYGKHRHTECSTCYEHFNDYDWNLLTNVGPISIARVDRQGWREPHRWTIAQVGEPVAKEHEYTNYVKGAPDSLFHAASLAVTYQDKIPAYPAIYDYYRADRVIAVGVNIPNPKAWSNDLSGILRDLGPHKQADVIVVITNQASAQYGEALKTAWLGGKKNDVTVVIGAPAFPAIAWVQVFSWSKQDIVNVALRNDILAQKNLTREGLMNAIHADVGRYYVRRPMSDFEYLKDEVDAPTWVIIIALLLSTAGSVGLGMFFLNNDITASPKRRQARYSI